MSCIRIQHVRRVALSAALLVAGGCTLVPLLPWDTMAEDCKDDPNCPDMRWDELIKPCEKDKDCQEGYYCSEQTCLPGYPPQPDASIIVRDQDGGLPDGAIPVGDGGNSGDASPADAG